MVQENIVCIRAFTYPCPLESCTAGPVPSGKSQQCGSAKPGCVESCPTPPAFPLALPDPLDVPVTNTYTCLQKPGSPSLQSLSLTEGLFSLAWVTPPPPFRLSSHLKGAFLPVFSSSWFPVCLFNQIVRSGKTASMFHPFLHAILIYIKVIFYLCIYVYMCVYVIYTHAF